MPKSDKSSKSSSPKNTVAGILEEPLSLLTMGGGLNKSSKDKKIDFDQWFRESIVKRDYTDFYHKEGELGKGATSIVFNVRDVRTGHEFAAKEISKSIDKKIVRTEAAILLKVMHKNIVRLHQIFETKRKVVLILEKVTGGELFDRIVERGCYTESDAANALKEIISAIEYLHSMNIVHRDLKPENLLYATTEPDSVLKVADFGLSKESGKSMQTVCGTPGYVAPEVVLGKSYTSSVDMWSLGVIGYILLSGYEPFYDERGDTYIFRKIVRGAYEFHSPWWDEVSDEAKDFIKNLLVLDPSRRFTAAKALKHPWLTNNSNSTKVLNTIDNMRQFNRNRRLKATVRVVQMSNMFNAEFNEKRKTPSPGRSPEKKSDSKDDSSAEDSISKESDSKDSSSPSNIR